jgi:hypothetical protein
MRVTQDPCDGPARLIKGLGFLSPAFITPVVQRLAANGRGRRDMTSRVPPCGMSCTDEVFGKGNVDDDKVWR